MNIRTKDCEALDPRTPTYEAIFKVARECLLGTGMSVHPSVELLYDSDRIALEFRTDEHERSDPFAWGCVNEHIPLSAVVAGNEALHREVVAACNRARTSISTALRATAAKLEPR